MQNKSHVTVSSSCTTLKKFMLFRSQINVSSLTMSLSLLYSTLIMCPLTVWLYHEPARDSCLCMWVCSMWECVCCLQTHRRIARKKEQPLVRVNNAIMVAHTRLMIADWGWGGETGDEFNYLEDTHLLTHYLSHTNPWQGYIALNGVQ